MVRWSESPGLRRGIGFDVAVRRLVVKSATIRTSIIARHGIWKVALLRPSMVPSGLATAVSHLYLSVIGSPS
jgi:hypothetical protein